MTSHDPFHARPGRPLRTAFCIALRTALGALLAAALPLGSVAAQQSAASRGGVGDTSIFALLHLSPGPNVYRDASGAPGPKYWQNRADYDLHATLDTADTSVSGTMTLRYTNNSPDTLHFLWIQTEQNAFKDGSLNSLVFAQNSRFGALGFNGGDVITKFAQVVGKKSVSVTLHDHGTVTKVDLAEPLAPGHSTTLEAAWHFLVPVHGADRMGRDGALYEMAQWYPRMCVYDDVSGWNTDPYLGQGEFYLEYGDFSLSVTVPAGYIVAATGMLENPQDVLTATERQRLSVAAKADTVVHIATADELTSGAARPKKTGTLTWKFHAKNVRDVAWAASPDYEWDATSWKGILAQSYYRAASAFNWDDAADQARMSIQEYSERWFQYPYPQVSVVEGTVYGMEYPMLAMEGRAPNKPGLYGVITHEVGHNWFPMIVGSNERLHAWMDEGFNTFINTFSEARRYPQSGSQEQRVSGLARTVAGIGASLPGGGNPIDILPDRITQNELGMNDYYKTAVGLQLLRQSILGPETFDAAFRTYIQRWAFKHPTPVDFFRTMENVAGERLDWFWREWFLENPSFDQAVDTVVTRQAGDTERLAVRYRNDARGVLPILARFTFSDGTTQEFDYPAIVWSTDSKYYVRHYAFPGKTVTRIDLDPKQQLMDGNRSNNSWTAPSK